MSKEFQQIAWDKQTEADWRQLVRLAMDEDLGEMGDLTTRALVPEHAIGQAHVVARQPGVVAGLPGAEVALEHFDPRMIWEAVAEEGQAIAPGDCLARIEGPVQSLLTAERLILNLLGRLSGIATLTRRYVEAVEGTKAKIYDTRKTTPGWRRLEKYAVHRGGGQNHRTGLFEAVLIKDNHLAFGAQAGPAAGSQPLGGSFSPAEAIEQARHFIKTHLPVPLGDTTIIEIEVDTLEQLDAVLPLGPDIVLLDNMPPKTLCQAVARRNAGAPSVELEASGGIDLETVRAIAESGVDRISVGALTHSAICLDIGLDWPGGI